MLYYKEIDLKSLIVNKLLTQGILEKKVKIDDEEVVEYYLNTIFTLDTETTSYFFKEDLVPFMFDPEQDNEFYKETEKQGLMYIWMVGIDDTVVFGRTYHEMHDFFTILQNSLYNTKNHEYLKIKIYVHNLSFDFQFLLNALGTDFEVFSRDSRKVMSAKKQNLEFYCSYFLTGQSLESYAEAYDLPVKKLSGSLDYTKMRTPLTPLTEEELAYCEHDILVLYEIIKQHEKKFGSLVDIPLTMTGKVRRQVKRLFYRDKAYKEKILNAWPSAEMYQILCEVYMGGYTHANRFLSNQLLKNVISIDFKSSYPYELTTKKFPMYQFRKTDEKYKDIDKDKWAVIIDFGVEDLQSKTQNSFLSVSKGYTKDGNRIKKGDGVFDNGRIVSIKEGRFILTEQDFEIFKQVYSWKRLVVKNIYKSSKEYLPKKYIEYLLDLFAIKTEFKDIDDKRQLYEDSKKDFNSNYGMQCTKSVRDEVIFEHGDWKTKPVQTIQQIQSILSDEMEKSPFLLFQVGVWCSAYARNHLWRNIIKLDDICSYTDTDSEKVQIKNEDDIERVKKVIEENQKEVFDNIEKVCEKMKIDKKRFFPKDKKGKVHVLGTFDIDGYYSEFKCLGAKKYCVKYSSERLEDFNFENKEKKQNQIEITVSGINKKSGSKRIKDIDRDFRVGVLFDYDEAGKNEAHYNDNQKKITFPDGWVEKSKFGICLKPTTYTLGLTPDYVDILQSSTSASLLEEGNDFDFDFEFDF